MPTNLDTLRDLLDATGRLHAALATHVSELLDASDPPDADFSIGLGGCLSAWSEYLLRRAVGVDDEDLIVAAALLQTRVNQTLRGAVSELAERTGEDLEESIEGTINGGAA